MFKEKNEFGYANLLFTGTIVFLVLLSLLGVDRMLNRLFPTEDYVVAALISAVKYACVLGIYLYLVRNRLHAYPGVSASEEVLRRLRVKMIKPARIGLSIVFGFAILPVLYFVNGLSLFFAKDVTVNRAVESSEEYPLPLFFIALAVIPPILEECIYRGVYLGVYSKAGIVKGMFLSAILFALMHSNLNQFVYAFFAGMVFAVFSYINGSVIASIIVHMIVNGTSTFMLYFPDLAYPEWMTVMAESPLDLLKKIALPVLAGSAVCGGIFALIMRKEKGYNSDTITCSDRIIDGTLIIGLITMVVNIIAVEMQ